MELSLTKTNFDAEVLSSPSLVLVDFFATWCGPCAMIAPHVATLAEEYPTLKVCRLDVDEAGDVAGRYGIQSIPTLMFFRNGTAVKTVVGYQELDSLRRTVEELL